MKIQYSKSNFKPLFEYNLTGNCKHCLYFLDMVQQMLYSILQKCEWGSFYSERKCSSDCLQGTDRQIMIFVIKVWKWGDSMFFIYKLGQISIKSSNFYSKLHYNTQVQCKSLYSTFNNNLVQVFHKFSQNLSKLSQIKQDNIDITILHKFSQKIPNLDYFKNKLQLQRSISDQQLYLTSIMKGSILRDKKQPNKVEVFQTAKPLKRPHNVKTVEIFMDNLDRQIKESYKKLKKNKDKLVSPTKQQTLLEETLPHAFSSTLHKTQQSNFGVTFTTSPPRQTEKTYPDASDIVLLDNKEVMDYISLVYDRYNIKDPMQGSEEGEIERCMTNKKIRKFKDRCQRQIGSASTMKNSQIYRSIELNPFLQPKKSLAKKEHSSGVKIEVVSLFSRNQSRNVSNQKGGEQGRSRQSTQRMKNQNVLQKKQKIVVTANNQPQSNDTAGLASVPQLFRFCFMCEQPILECNLVSHEKSCEQLKKAMLYSFEELLSILDKKINRLINQINSQLLQKTEQRIKEEFRVIKLSVKNWLNQLPLEHNNRMRRQYGSNWRGQFTKIEENITNSVCSSFHLLHKLQWFTKLHQNITKNMMRSK